MSDGDRTFFQYFDCIFKAQYITQAETRGDRTKAKTWTTLREYRSTFPSDGISNRKFQGELLGNLVIGQRKIKIFQPYLYIIPIHTQMTCEI